MPDGAVRLYGVLESTLRVMVSLGATLTAIRVGIGPAIQQRSYEVGAEFLASFLKEDGSNMRFFLQAVRPAHFLFDLPKFVEERLRQSGLNEIDRSPLDTLTEEDRFFSYRRATLCKEPVYGRGISLIGLA